MEEGLLVKKEEEEQGLKWKEIREEMKRMCKIAGPMIAVMMSQYMIQVVTLMMVGHLGNLYLASTALAVSLAAVTGFSLMVYTMLSFSFMFENYRWNLYIDLYRLISIFWD